MHALSLFQIYFLNIYKTQFLIYQFKALFRVDINHIYNTSSNELLKLTIIIIDSKDIQIGLSVLTVDIFVLQGIASSELQDDTVIVLEKPSCPTNYVVLGDTCGELKVGIFIFRLWVYVITYFYWIGVCYQVSFYKDKISSKLIVIYEPYYNNLLCVLYIDV